MSINDEYLRLPKGMFDHKDEWVRLKREILDNHDMIGRRIGSELIELSPLGFRDTFTRASHNTGDKVYEFTDKGGRQLFLACDSTPGVLRAYCNTCQQGSSRVSFVAPIFRYRDGPTRHFSQIGYAAINEPNATGNVDFPLLQLIGAITRLFEMEGLRIHVYINDFFALRRLLEDGGVGKEEISGLLHRIQFSTLEQRKGILTAEIRKHHVLLDLLNVLTKEQQNVPYKGIYDMAEAIREYSGTDVFIDTTNLHSIETISGYAVNFRTPEGIHVGDGGQYNDFGNRFHDRIKTLRSVATGVEAIAHSVKPGTRSDPQNKVIVFSLGASDAFVVQALLLLQQHGFSVVFGGPSFNIVKDIQKAAKEHSHLAILGSDEERTLEIKVKELTKRTTRVIKLNCEPG